MKKIIFPKRLSDTKFIFLPPAAGWQAAPFILGSLMQHEPEAGVSLACHSFAADGGWLTGPERPDDFCFLMILAGRQSVAKFKVDSLWKFCLSFADI